MKNNKFTITKEQIMTMERASRRLAEIESGFIPTHKVHKSAKAYTRKDKHKIKYV
jgi:hypothetical protein